MAALVNLLILVCVLGLEISVCWSSAIDKNLAFPSRSGLETHHLQRVYIRVEYYFTDTYVYVQTTILLLYIDCIFI